MENMHYNLEAFVCPNCLERGHVSLEKRRENVSIRGTSIDVIKQIRVCNSCNFEFESSNDGDWRIDAYKEFRRIHNYVTPEEIKAWREKFDLTQIEVANLLGWGESTIGRYEKGALQSAAHDEALRNIMSPQNLMTAIHEKKDIISDSKISKIKTKIMPTAISDKFNDLILMVFNDTNLSELNGMTQFSKLKTITIISYIIKKGDIFKTKLNKILFYCDFYNFKLFKASITGLKYARIDFGPVPDQYELLYSYAISKNIISTKTVNIGDEIYEKFTKPDEIIDDVILSEQEKESIEYVYNHFKCFSSKEIVDFSHEEDAWKNVKNGKIINYNYSKTLKI